MSYLTSYKRLNRLIQNETFEPLISWGLRMGLAGTLPIVWGLYTGRMVDAVWMALTAEAVSWVEMKGSFTWRVRTLLAAAVFAVLFSVLGLLTGANAWLSIGAMLVVGFLATLFKNIGDRASGLALCVYLTFIICNAYPEVTYTAFKHRILLVSIGAVWPVLLGIAISLVMPAEEPFRRQIALIWRAVAELAETIATDVTDNNVTKTRTDIYQKENDIRNAMNNSYQFYGRMAYQVSTKDNKQYQLAMVRKAGGLVSVNIIAIGEEMELLGTDAGNKTLRLNFNTLFNAMKEAVARISVFIITLKPEEKLLAISQINRIKNLSALVRQYPVPADEQQSNALAMILKYTDRTVKLLESAIQRIEQMGNDQPVFRSYSLIKTSFILKPQYFVRNIKGLFNLSTITTRYALRSAIAAAIGMFFYKCFHIDHGYWLPFSVMIVKQAYFGATIQKARQRITGTVLGVIAGSLLLRVPAGLHIKEGVLFLSFVLMVYYMRKNYATAAFIITINLVLLFSLESAYNETIMISRVLCTVGGALLAITSSFALLPNWDKKWLSTHIAAAIDCNYDYFKATFFAAERPANWTRNKRSAESKNNNVFDSFNRYLEEPGAHRSERYYDLLTSNVRITRNLNNIHMEQDEKKQPLVSRATTAQQARINECLEWFNKVLQQLGTLYPGIHVTSTEQDTLFSSPFLLNDAQMLSLEKLIIELKSIDLALKDLPR